MENDYSWVEEEVRKILESYDPPKPEWVVSEEQVKREIRELEETCLAYQKDLANEILTEKEIRGRLQKYIDQRKEKLANFPINFNNFNNNYIYHFKLLVWFKIMQKIQDHFDPQATPKQVAPKKNTFPEAELGLICERILKSENLIDAKVEKADKWKIRVLYQTLRAKGLLEGPSPSEWFSTFLDKRFAISISGRALRSKPTNLDNKRREDQLRRTFLPMIR